MIRTFIAVPVTEEVESALVADMRILRQAAPRVRWVETCGMHLTLKFLGDVAEPDLEELFDAVREAAAELTAFAVEMSDLGVFPHWGSPRVVWAGCGEGGDDLRLLARRVEDACEDLGYPREVRPFAPHLTLGRIKLPADAHGLQSAVNTIENQNYGFLDVDEAVVYMSELRRSGPVYSPMFRAPLGTRR